MLKIVCIFWLSKKVSEWTWQRNVSQIWQRCEEKTEKRNREEKDLEKEITIIMLLQRQILLLSIPKLT